MTALQVALDWTVRWETELSEGEQTAITPLLQRAFPGHPGGIERAWTGSRPELRLLGYDGDRLAAHIGVTRRFLRSRTSGASFLVGDVGMVAIDPDLQGRGLGRELMQRTHQELQLLVVTFGVLTTGDGKVGFYEAAGWTRAVDTTLHAIDLWNHTEVVEGPVMFVPVTASASDWPVGGLERNGQEI